MSVTMCGQNMNKVKKPKEVTEEELAEKLWKQMIIGFDRAHTVARTILKAYKVTRR